jgi:undecaprenyl-diphosphatase
MTTTQPAALMRWVNDRDLAVCGALNRISRPLAVKKFFVIVSWLGDGKAWYWLILALPVAYGESGLAASWIMIKVAVVNLLLYKTIKALAGRARPCAVSTDITLGTAPLDQYSFPSGHTIHAVAFTMVVTAYHPELAGGLVVFSSLIAFSRVILGLHYPTDVIAGAVIGASVATLSLKF